MWLAVFLTVDVIRIKNYNGTRLLRCVLREIVNSKKKKKEEKRNIHGMREKKKGKKDSFVMKTNAIGNA